MRKHLKLLIVIADGEHDRFVRQIENYSLHSETHLSAETVHESTSNLGKDQRGSTFHTSSSAHHGLAPCMIGMI